MRAHVLRNVRSFVVFLIVVAFQEVDGFWLAELRQLEGEWPHRVTSPRSGSPTFGQLLRDGHLHDSRRGFGRQPTWHTFRPIPGLWVDIDHILVSPRFWTADRRVGRANGSDHLPVVADLILRTKAADAGG